MLLKYRIVGGLGALLLAGTAVVTSTAVGGAVDNGGKVSDIITFSGRAYLAVAPTETKPGFGTLVSRECTLRSDTERAAVPCTLTASARLTLTGGTLTGTVRSRDGVIAINETFVNTSPTTGTGTGTATEFDIDDHASSTATFTVSFTTSPSGIAPNILNDHGTIIVTDHAGQPGDPDSGSTTTTVPATTVVTG
ncbi:MAG: hypothetical protein M3256_20515 [Actinomycetota bacterium]|nr:hypothetical protein [Actinomycetota bacterium]